MLIYRLEDENGNGPIGVDNLALDKQLLDYWNNHLAHIEPEEEVMELGNALGLTSHDTVCFGCTCITNLKRYWGKLFMEYQYRGLTVVVYEVPKELTCKGYLQVAFPRLYHQPKCIVHIHDWPNLKEA